MSEVRTVSRSLRVIRFRAGLPRAIAALFVLVLAVAGVRAILAPSRTAMVKTSVASTRLDQGAEAFAQAFTHAYLTWNANDPNQQQAALAPFISNALDQGAGVQPGPGSQTVEWTYVVGEHAEAGETLVTVGAQTTAGLVYLSVPVERDSRGFLFVPDYPAFVGPPASNTNADVPPQEQVEDSGLQTVVARAITNYLAGNTANLLADLTPNAVVSLPAEHMTVTNTQQANWVTPGHRVAIQVQASDTHHNSWTLSYEVTVERLDRWYVQSIQVDPTFEGG
jgi:hypothetical protein